MSLDMDFTVSLKATSRPACREDDEDDDMIEKDNVEKALKRRGKTENLVHGRSSVTPPHSAKWILVDTCKTFFEVQKKGSPLTFFCLWLMVHDGLVVHHGSWIMPFMPEAFCCCVCVCLCGVEC